MCLVIRFFISQEYADDQDDSCDEEEEAKDHYDINAVKE